jgi:hypothetical protein
MVFKWMSEAIADTERTNGRHESKLAGRCAHDNTPSLA